MAHVSFKKEVRCFSLSFVESASKWNVVLHCQKSGIFVSIILKSASLFLNIKVAFK